MQANLVAYDVYDGPNKPPRIIFVTMKDIATGEEARLALGGGGAGWLRGRGCSMPLAHCEREGALRHPWVGGAEACSALYPSIQIGYLNC